MLKDGEIEDTPKLGKVCGALVLVIEVIGVFPNVETEDWGEVILEWVVHIGEG